MVLLGTSYVVIVTSLIWKLRLTEVKTPRNKRSKSVESSSDMSAEDYGSISDMLTEDGGSSSNIPEEEDDISPDIQMFKHTLLLLALTVTMWTGL